MIIKSKWKNKNNDRISEIELNTDRYTVTWYDTTNSYDHDATTVISFDSLNSVVKTFLNKQRYRDYKSMSEKFDDVVAKFNMGIVDGRYFSHERHENGTVSINLTRERNDIEKEKQGLYEYRCAVHCCGHCLGIYYLHDTRHVMPHLNNIKDQAVKEAESAVEAITAASAELAKMCMEIGIQTRHDMFTEQTERIVINKDETFMGKCRIAFKDFKDKFVNWLTA